MLVAESLKFSSAISTFLAVAFVTTCTVLAIIAIVEGRTQSPKLIPRLDKHTTFFDLFTAVPVIVTAYTFHFNGTCQVLINGSFVTLSFLVDLGADDWF